MSILRSILSLLAGYFIMAFLIAICTLGCMIVLHQRSGHPTAAYLALNILYSLAAALLGGLITAKIALRSPLLHGLILAGIVFIAAALLFPHSGNGQPLWYRIFLMIGPPLAVVWGASLTRPRDAATRL